ncbi:5'-nucleotidase C-terminal domain-containing protein [Sulfurimonas sp. SAG-AH-194-C21]|nr:5'-nucleotidase C-terminal domain-containing protein [Sulfurimonas sp. SAG-AH-194-C21]MDF1882846.1 5'-nucleotidase C-terminal domain-containing protein [Sulfurimonas sp. SAG-AH-194-C21]
MKLSKSICYKSVALSLSVLLFQACNPSDTVPKVVLPNGTVSLIELNDLHAHIVPHIEQVRDANDSSIILSSRGGLARIKAKMTELTNSGTIIMNVGDTFHGGAEALFSNGNDIVDLVNDLPIDIAVMGNWDFAYGAPATLARFGNVTDAKVKRPSFPYIAANMSYQLPLGLQKKFAANAPVKALATNVFEKTFKMTMGEDVLSPTTMITKNGIKVGFIGITSDIINRMSPLLASMIKFPQGEAAYIALIEKYSTQLKGQGANIIVVMSELGIHKDVQLGNKIKANSVDVFFSAHTHEATFKMINTTSGAKVVESGDDTYLGEMKVTVTEGKITSYAWKLHEITNDIVPDPALLAKINTLRAKYLNPNVSITTNGIPPNIKDANLTAPELNMAKAIFTRKKTPIVLNAPLDKFIGTTTLPLTRKNVLENGFNSVLGQLLTNNKNATLGILPGFRYDDAIIPAQANSTSVNGYNWTSEANVVLNGNITIENIYRFLPSTNFVATANITGANIKKFIENELTSAFSSDAFKQAGGWMPGITGIKINVAVNANDGTRLIGITDLNDVGIDDATILSVASACAREFEPTPTLAQTVICGQALFTDVVQDKNMTTANFLIDAFSKNLDENITDTKRITDSANTPLWPASPYVQPVSQIIDSIQ